MWFCSHCRISLPGTKKLVKRIGDLESQQSNFERQVKELKELVSKKPEENGSNHEINIGDIVSEVLSEQNERDYRKLNVVCFGMKESDCDIIEERRADEISKLNSLVHDIMNLPNTEVNDIIRLGKFVESRVRPVRFSVESVSDKQTIIERSHTHVHRSPADICKNIYFQSDLTKKQRDEEYLKRVERRKRNAESFGRPTV